MLTLTDVVFSPKDGLRVILLNWKLFSLIVSLFVLPVFYYVYVKNPTYVVEAAYFSRSMELPYKLQFSCLQKTDVVSTTRVKKRLFVKANDSVEHKWDKNSYSPAVPIFILTYKSPELFGLSKKVEKYANKVVLEATECARVHLERRQSVFMKVTEVGKRDVFQLLIINNQLSELEEMGAIGKFVIGDPVVKRPSYWGSLGASLFTGILVAFLTVFLFGRKRQD
ncbi:hypothetical protein N9T26_01870 [Alphaproteobacteria bacterium]|nr:hypothetical protein [Alphaproteobacteria bacterium]